MRSSKLCLSKIVLITVCATSGAAVAAGPKEAPGVLALSAGDSVVLVNTLSSVVQTVETGPVGLLFPGPGGVLFAPDLVNGRTTVMDFRTARVLERMAGVTMPRFGPFKDRYLVIAGALTVVSYPERSFISQMEGSFDRPWQIEIAPEGSSLLILERDPVERSGAVLTAVDLSVGEIVRQRKFSSDLVRFAVVSSVGLLAVVDPQGRRIRLLDPATFADVRDFPVDGEPTDIAVLNLGKEVVVAGVGGRILRWRFKRQGNEVRRKELDSIPVGGRALQLEVAPDEKSLAAVVESGRLLLFRAKGGVPMGAWEIPAAVRDLVWCDPEKTGPLLPSWSDEGSQ